MKGKESNGYFANDYLSGQSGQISLNNSGVTSWVDTCATYTTANTINTI